MPEDNKGAPLSAPLASDALLLRCCPQLLPASSLPFPPCSMPSDRPLRLPPFRLTASQRTGASYALAMCAVASMDGSGCRFFVLLASSPPVLPIFSVPPSISFADLFCRGDLDTQKRSVSHCLGDVSNRWHPIHLLSSPCYQNQLSLSIKQYLVSSQQAQHSSHPKNLIA